MDTTLLTILVLGFALGIKHALDADHVVAVSTIVSQYRNPLKATVVGIFWGIGHTTTLLLVGIAVIGFKLVIPDQLALSMEFLVGVVLFALGVQIRWQYLPKKKHTHIHDHGDEMHTHEHVHPRNEGEKDVQHLPPRQYKSLLLGMIHGLAGSAALMLLVLSTIQSPVEGVVYILVFGVGSILGMMVISTLIGLPFALSSKRFASLNHTIRFTAGTLSAALGIFVMIDIGLIKGLFHGL
ncbi:MAG: sulfite exporter TauE/SafE family protein [Anaerolineae bacterium]|nr:sulfite exporter TauE/SafE family protein [Anaerolineae bacterium]